MEEKEIVEMYDSGKSTYEIAGLLNTYPNKVRRILIKNGVELKTKSEAQVNALEKGSSSIPTKGKKRSSEDKIKISSGLKKMWEEMDEKTYQKHVETSRTRWNQLSAIERENMKQSAIKAIRVAGKEGSKLEKFLFSQLTMNGYVVEFHKKNLIPNQNLEIDMYIPSCKTIIEIDGPSHFLPIWGEEKLQKQIKADSVKTGLILNKGFIIIRIKSLSDKVCLSGREKLRNNILKILEKLDQKFPSRIEERYIEVET